MTSIDEAIKSKFENEHQRALINLAYTSSELKHAQSKYMKSFGITAQQYNVLRILRGQHPETTNPGYVKSVMIEKAPDLTRLLDRLVNKGLVHRSVNPENRREVHLKISQEGLDHLEALDPQVRSGLEQLKDIITTEEANQLSDILDKIRSHFNNHS